LKEGQILEGTIRRWGIELGDVEPSPPAYF